MSYESCPRCGRQPVVSTSVVLGIDAHDEQLLACGHRIIWISVTTKAVPDLPVTPDNNMEMTR